ncbi:hypothetical protein BH11PSE11_BH11PSE11_28960 [soil metagenome]
MKIIHLLFLASALLSAACSRDDMVDKFLPKQEDLEARTYMQQLQERKFDKIEARLEAGLKSPSLRASLEQMAGFFPAEPPISIKAVGAETTLRNGAKEVSLSYEFTYPAKWLLVNVVTREKASGNEIIGFHVVPESSSLESRSRFSFDGKSALHFLCLALALAAALFTLFTLIVCIRTRPLQRKWLWILGILFGLGRFELNWMTGETSFSVLHVQLFSAGLVASPYGPWLLTVSMPVFAMLFWIRRKDLMRQSHAARSVAQ